MDKNDLRGQKTAEVHGQKYQKVSKTRCRSDNVRSGSIFQLWYLVCHFPVLHFQHSNNFTQLKRPQQMWTTTFGHETNSQPHELVSQLESDDMLPLSPGKTSMCSILCGGDERAEYERGASPNFGDSLMSTVTGTIDS